MKHHGFKWFYLLLTAALVLLSTMLCANPLAGNYSVGGAQADFSTLGAAIAAANTNGISADVAFNLNDGIYEGPFVINLPESSHQLSIQAAEGIQAILINPNSSSTENYILKINNSSNIKISRLTFTSSGTYSRCLSVHGNSDNLYIHRNIFNGVVNASTSYGELVYFYADSPAAADNVDIRLNSFYNGAYHVSVYANSYLASFDNWNFHINGHTNGYGGLGLSRMSNLRIYGEIMENVNTGISLTGCSGNLDMDSNEIFAWNAGIKIMDSSFSASALPNVYNNVVQANGIYWYSPGIFSDGIGMYIGNCSNVFAAHNSVLCSAPTQNSYALYLGGSNNRISKNILHSSGNGLGLYLGSTNNNQIDYNNIYSVFTNLARISNTYYKTIDELNSQLGSDNRCYYPYFTDNYLRTQSPVLDNYGPDLGVSIDFNGVIRSGTTDIGAHEWTSDPALVPLSGTLSVGSGGDFGTLSGLFTALGMRGITGQVFVNLLDPLYEEQFEVFTIPSANASDHVFIAAPELSNATIRWSAQTATQNYLMRFNRSKNISFTRVSFDTAATSNSNLLIFNGWNHYIRFINCQFSAPSGANGSSLYSAYNCEAKDITVLASSFYNNAYGINLYGAEPTVGSCYFSGQQYGVSVNGANDAQILGNVFENCSHSAIQVNSGNRVTITHNCVSGTGTGIYLSNLSGDNGVRNLVANNAIYITNSNNNNNGISLGGTDINLLNNTVLTEGQYAYPLYAYQMGANTDVVNNIFAANQALAMELSYYTPSDDKVIDYNCYYSGGNNLARISGYYSSLTDLQAAYPSLNAHSLSLYPHLSADLHTQSPWLRRVGIFRSEITNDMDHEPRGDLFDIGADQQTGEYGFEPLFGAYTIGSGGDYASVEAFIADLELMGTLGDVTVNLLAGEYTGYYSLNNFPKVVASSSVTFQAMPGATFSLNTLYTYNYENFLFKLSGADYVQFKNFNISVGATNRQNSIFLLQGKCDNIVIENCNFTFNNVYSIAVYAENSINEGLTLKNCNLNGGAFGAALSGNGYSSNFYQNIRIENCVFTNVGCPFSISKATNVKLLSNQFTNFSSTPALSYVYGNTDIVRNKFRAHNFVGSYNTVTLLSLSNVDGTSDQPIEIAANILYSHSNQCQAGYGITINNSNHLRLYHNTISMDNSYVFEYGAALSLSNVSNLNAINNIFNSPSTGYAVTLQQSSNLYFGNNAYFNGSKNLGSINSILYEPLDFIHNQLQDVNGVFANPLIDANGYSTCSYLAGKASASYISADIDYHLWGADIAIGANYQLGTEPLSGTVNVGSSGAFATPEAALDALMSRGVSANTQVYFQSGFYSLNKVLSYIPGSISYPVTLSGAADAYIYGYANSTGDNYMLALRSVRNLVLDGLKLSPQNSNFARGITFSRYNKDVSIQNCHLVVEPNTITQDVSAAIYAYDAHAVNLNITGCTMQNFAYGVYASGNNAYPELNTGLQIMQNSMENLYYGIYLYNLVSPVIIANQISGYRYQGIALSSNKSALRVERNSISGSGLGALRVYSHSSLESRPRFATNYLFDSSLNSYSTFEITSVPNADVFFNTIVRESSNVNAYAFHQGSACTGMAFANNLVQGGAGLAARFYQFTDLNRYDHNLFHTAGANKVQLGSTNIGNLAQWLTATGDNTAVFADPLLNSGTYTFQSGSPAINAGVAIAGLEWDINAYWRDLPDLGCWEYGVMGLEAPTNLQISYDAVNSEIVLTWSPVSGATGYVVYSANNPEMANENSTQVSGTSLRLPASQTYRFYRVSARN